MVNHIQIQISGYRTGLYEDIMWHIFATRCLKYIHNQRKSSLQRGGKPGACLNYTGFTRINAKIKHSVSVMCKFLAVARLGRSLSLLSSSLSEWLHGLIQSEIPNWCSCTPVIPAGLCNSQHQCNTIDKCNAIHYIDAIKFDKCNVIHYTNTTRFDKCKMHFNTSMSYISYAWRFTCSMQYKKTHNDKFQFKNSMGFDSI